MSTPFIRPLPRRASLALVLGLCFLLLSACSTALQSAAPPQITEQASVVTQAGNGLAVIRTDQFQKNTARGDHSWQAQRDTSSQTVMTLAALPDINRAYATAPVNRSPQLDYQVQFVKTGVHYVWVYGQAPAKNPLNGDSVHLGIDGTAPASSSQIGNLKQSYGWINLKMSGGPATINVTKTGLHTLNLWMREDGARVSAIALSTDPKFRPTQSILATGGPQQPTDSSIEPVQARAADAFIDTVGVNTHLHYTDTVWGQKYNEIIKPKLLALGVRHARDGLYTYPAASRDSFYYSRLRELGAAGLRFNLIAGMRTRFGDTTNFSLLDDIYSWTGGTVVSFEGVNEPNLQGIGDWVSQTRAVQKNLYEIVKSTPSLAKVKVIGPSPIGEAAATLGDMSALMDYGNSHAYTGGAMPMLTGYGSLAYNLGLAEQVSSSDPVAITEVGYHNAVKTTMTHPPTSEAVAAIYIPRMFLSYFNEGVARTYLYEFIDSQPDPSLNQYYYHFGLLRNDGSEKPAYLALKNLLNLLKDPGGVFTPGSLRFSLSGNTQNVHQTLLQKRDGTFYLALWVEESSWDRDARRELAVPSRTVDLQLGDPVGTVTRYAFSQTGSAPASTLVPNNGKLSVNLDDKLTLLQFAPAQ